MKGAVPWRAYLLLTSGMAVVGAYVGFSKVIVATVPVFLLGSIRFGIAALVMLPWSFPKGSLAVLRSQRKLLFLQSFFGNFLFTICMLSGVSRTSATAAGLIMSTLPAAVALLSFLTLRERLGVRTSAAVALAVLGIAVLNVERGAASERAFEWLGNLLIVGAVCCEALYVVLGKRLTSANVGPMQISAWINLVGLVLMLPLGLAQARDFDFSTVTPALWTLIVIYSLAASIASTWLWLSGLKAVPANQAGVFTIALPVTSAAVGVLFLSESLSIAHAIAFTCAIVGLILVASERQPVKGR
jgi:drug/metabolite transporter (DMT)-like permease